MTPRSSPFPGCCAPITPLSHITDIPLPHWHMALDTRGDALPSLISHFQPVSFPYRQFCAGPSRCEDQEKSRMDPVSSLVSSRDITLCGALPSSTALGMVAK